MHQAQTDTGITQLIEAPDFEALVQELSTSLNRPVEAVRSEAISCLKELYTEHKPVPQLISSEVAQFLLARGYDRTIDVKPAELKKLTRLMRKYPVAFVMSHKTYLDTIVLAIVLLRHGMPLPYTFAGNNMAFPGLDQLGRSTGVIFIRRMFKGQAIYRAVLRHYIRLLIEQGKHFMWAIEGTRSRTGKLVWPKMGILKYIMEGEKVGPRPVQYVPVSIVYDLIPDVKDITLENLGEGKQPETLSWFLNYLRKLGNHFGKISIRFDDPVVPTEKPAQPGTIDSGNRDIRTDKIPHFAFQLVHRINQITPVTTTSLVCTSLLSKYALTRKGIEQDVADLMLLIESHKKDALVDRGQSIGASVQRALNLLMQKGIIRYQAGNPGARYQIVDAQYLPATYYANMAVHHLFHRAFIELSLLLSQDQDKVDRPLYFWTTIMELRELFKFEFFYAARPHFSSKIEADLQLFQEPDQLSLYDHRLNFRQLLAQQKVRVAPVVLSPYLEAYQVVIQGLQLLDTEYPFDENNFIESCLTLGGELQWKGIIKRAAAISRPFLINGLRLARHLDLIPNAETPKTTELLALEQQIALFSQTIQEIHDLDSATQAQNTDDIPMERAIVPGSRSFDISQEILNGPKGAHIAAFFDLDRTLIKGFSAKDFFQTRLLSGKMTPGEIVGQFAGVMVYALGNRNFDGLVNLGARGVKGIQEQVFIEVGEAAYLNHLAEAIYPESRALVAAHLAMGHEVAIISAATPYQIAPVARGLDIPHFMCTNLEVEAGVFTGRVIEPTCWGAGKAYAARQFAESRSIDLSQSYFYTDSADDLPLLEIVGHPRPINPDVRLSGVAFQKDWPIYRFDDDNRPGLSHFLRTGLTLASLIPAALGGIMAGASAMNWKNGVNNMIALVGDLGTNMAGISLIVKHEENIWNYRPAVFIFNHQSNADLFIMAKLLRKDVTGVAKQELQHIPILGQMMASAGIIFIDRKNREKAIEALQPAIDSLKNGISLAIAPEGTRSYSYQLGPFKKGAFHLAMQAGVPLVPVVIKNAHDAMPRGSHFFRPSAIEVIVHPGIPTHDWTRDNLNDKIQEVRAIFLKDLNQTDVKKENEADKK